jgi:hypothetical protein
MSRLLLSLAGLLATIQAPTATGPDLTLWPNAQSSANSDRWLVEHHDQLRRLEPRLLVLDFVNGVPVADIAKKTEELIAALAESSRYHGFEDDKAPVFLQYRIAKLVDLTDPEPLPKTPDGSSTKYPRVKDWKEGINLDYAALHTQEFAAHYGYPDPRKKGRFLTLGELVANGAIHELWLVARQGEFGSPFECIEQKPVYDAKFARVSGEHRQCGNGGDDHEPFEGRSLRINYINYDRGIGCAMENFGHSFECMAHADVIPYFKKYFHEFADFDLDKRWGLPVDSLYAADAGGKDKAEYPDPHTLVVHHAGKELRVENFVANAGNVHFPPNGRHDYDLDNPAPVLSTIEHWRRFDGAGGKDKTIEFTPARFAKYNELASDCMGPWLVYWRQNVPGLDNKSLDDEKKPMKNWWPFLFY